MIPNTDKALRMLSQRMMMTILPDLKSTYTMSDGMMIGLLVNAIADELSNGIERRLQDIREMQALFGQYREELDDTSRITASPENYSLEAVNSLHDALTRDLIRLHERAEAGNLSELNNDIWRYLRTTAERHRITAIP